MHNDIGGIFLPQPFPLGIKNPNQSSRLVRGQLLAQPSNSGSPPQFWHLTQFHYLHLRTGQTLLISLWLWREMEKVVFRKVFVESPLVGGS
jgi:hypothetical protein